LVFKWGDRLGACVPDAFRNRFGRGWPFQILKVDALNFKQPTLCTESSTPPIGEDLGAKCLRRPSAFLLAIGLQVGGFRLGACVPDAFWTKFGRGWPFQILRVDALKLCSRP
jgi:hypothetical protein